MACSGNLYGALEEKTESYCLGMGFGIIWGRRTGNAAVWSQSEDNKVNKLMITIDGGSEIYEKNTSP